MHQAVLGQKASLVLEQSPHVPECPCERMQLVEGWGCLGILLRSCWLNPTPTWAPLVTRFPTSHLFHVLAGWLQGLTCWKNILVKSGTCVSGWRSPSALMTACGSSSNTGSAARPVGMVGEARAAHFCHDWGTSEGRALKLSFTLFKAPC